MALPSPVQVLDLIVRLDYGQFSLTGVYLPAAADADPLRLLEEAIGGQGIAGTEGNEYVVVLSPHQNNFAMPLRVEVWPAEPPSDLDDWQEAFLAGLVVGAGGLDYDSPTMEGTNVPVPPGRYAVRITGRGFVNWGWPGSTTPGDEWRLQLWPAPGAIRPRRLRSWTPPASKERVMRRHRLPTKRAAVELALRRLAGEPMSREEALATEGAGWSGDLDELRAPDAAAIVTMELLAGAAAQEKVVRLRRLLLRCRLLPIEGLADHEAAAELYRRRRAGGETVRSLTDCLIVVVALRHGAALLHCDHDFDVLARHTPLRVAGLRGAGRGGPGRRRRPGQG